VRVLDELAGLPRPVGGDRHGQRPEFTGRGLVTWSARTGVRLRFIEPGKPIQNAFVESFMAGFGTSV
jgi:putative transposase